MLALAIAGRTGYPSAHSRRNNAAPDFAALAQPVEHVIRNDGVRCSSHLSGTSLFNDSDGFPRIEKISG
jgi:hypothetical protein